MAQDKTSQQRLGNEQTNRQDSNGRHRHTGSSSATKEEQRPGSKGNHQPQSQPAAKKPGHRSNMGGVGSEDDEDLGGRIRGKFSPANGGSTKS